MSGRMVRLTREDGYEKRWILVGPRGAVDFHCTLATHEIAQRFGRSGGVEYHHRQPPDYMNGKDHHGHCWILGGPCWHDGTSLWASEHWIPLLESGGEDAVWRELERTYASYDWPTTPEPKADEVTP